MSSSSRRYPVTAALATLGPVIGLAFVFLIFSFLRPSTFLTLSNLEIMLLQSAVVGMAALGMTMVIISGGIDLSVGSTIALCTVVIARLLAVGFSPLAAALCGVVTGSLCGLLTGFLVTRLKVTPFIVTLGMLGIYRGLAKGISSQQMVSAPETWLNDLLTSLAPGEGWRLLPSGVWATLAAALLTAGFLTYTKPGRHIFAIGSSELTARLCGVPVKRIKLLVFTLGATFAGLAGVLQFSYLTMGDPTTALGAELNVIAVVVIGGGSLSGGEGSVLGSLVGAFIMTVVGNGCTKLGLNNWVQEMVTGGIIVLAVALDRWRHRFE